MIERKIGEIFEHEGEWYQCVEGERCHECSFRKIDCSISNIGDCTDKRTDGVKVTFKKLEKVGAPYVYNGTTCQLYKSPIPIYATEAGYKIVRYDMIEVEIKQKQRNMEEKRLNLKPFDLEAAKAGKPVCTRNGRKARVVCFDAKFERPILVLIRDGEGERAHFYYEDGRCDRKQDFNDDLMMLPEKHEGWVNVYKTSIWRNVGSLYQTKEEAILKIDRSDGDYVDTVKIEWEE